MTPSGAPLGPAAIETHISWVFFTPERAYKLIKPVSLGFVDYREPEDRLVAAAREFELNRRIAPDVYLGLADVVEHGVTVDRMIVMRRLPTDRSLSALVGTDQFPQALRATARKIAAFHAAEAPLLDAPMATLEAVLANWEDNLASMAPHVGSVIDPTDHDRLCALVRAYLHHRAPLFDQRIAGGFVRDGHGDLIADDVFFLDDGPRIIDCLAFNDDWRIADVLCDIGFLVMDVHRLAGETDAAALMAWYQEFSNEQHPVSLAHHYVAYRAHVRAKVACLRYAQGDESSKDLARRYHELALHHLEQGRIRMILVGGGPGTGKSTLARGLSDRLGLTTLVNDEIRKDITGTPRAEHRFAAPGEGIYDTATTDAVYDELLRKAEILLTSGHGVIVDASWTLERHRAAARVVAERCGAEFVEFECVLPAAEAKQRIVQRLSDESDPSDATPGIVDHLTSKRDDWPSATRLSTEAQPAVVVGSAIDQLGAPPGPVADSPS